MFGVTIWREAPGVIGPTACWCAGYSCWLHTSGSLMGLLVSLVREWKHDRHLSG